MTKRIIAGIIAALLVVGATWYFASQQLVDTPPGYVPPVVETPIGPGDPSDPAPGIDLEAACSTEPGGTGMHGHDHDHDHGDGEGGTFDEGVASPCPDASGLTSQDMRELYQQQDRVASFLRAWFALTPDEAEGSRVTRLVASGAAGDVAEQVSRTARRDSAQPGLTATTRLRDMVSFVPYDRDEVGRIVLVTVNVEAEYRLPSGRGSDWVLGGHVLVWLDQQNRIVQVDEDFPDLAGLA